MVAFSCLFEPVLVSYTAFAIVSILFPICYLFRIALSFIVWVSSVIKTSLVHKAFSSSYYCPPKLTSSLYRDDTDDCMRMLNRLQRKENLPLVLQRGRINTTIVLPEFVCRTECYLLPNSPCFFSSCNCLLTLRSLKFCCFCKE